MIGPELIRMRLKNFSFFEVDFTSEIRFLVELKIVENSSVRISRSLLPLASERGN